MAPSKPRHRSPEGAELTALLLKVFGEDPENPQAVVVSIDTNDTHSVAEAFIGRIIFTNGSGEAALNR